MHISQLPSNDISALQDAPAPTRAKIRWVHFGLVGSCRWARMKMQEIARYPSVHPEDQALAEKILGDLMKLEANMTARRMIK